MEVAAFLILHISSFVQLDSGICIPKTCVEKAKIQITVASKENCFVVSSSS
jgi:hypothetical protein